MAPSSADAPDIDRRVALCAEQWGLDVGAQLDGGFLAHVYECRDADGRDLVLKLSPPIARPHLEATSLAAWDGVGTPRLRAFNANAGALLMERVQPGTLLSGQPGSFAIEAAAATLRALHSTCPRNPPGIPPFASWLDWYLERVMFYAEPGTVGVAMLSVLRDTAERLAASARVTTLVHGDFVSKNLLHAGNGTYLAIDPWPFLGDPCADVGLFAAYFPPARSIAGRAAALAEQAWLDPQRAMQWAAIWAIGEACETWREDSDELQEWVAGPECAELLAI